MVEKLVLDLILKLCGLQEAVGKIDIQSER